MSWLAGARIEGGCIDPVPACATTPLAPGESRTFTVRAEDPGATSVTVNARSEGADLAPADNSTVAGFLAAPPFDLVVADRQRLRRGSRCRCAAWPAVPRA